MAQTLCALHAILVKTERPVKGQILKFNTFIIHYTINFYVTANLLKFLQKTK